jgi:hypothetical protein
MVERNARQHNVNKKRDGADGERDKSRENRILIDRFRQTTVDGRLRRHRNSSEDGEQDEKVIVEK